MKSLNRFPCQLGAASSLVLAACGVLAQDSDSYTPLGLANRPALQSGALAGSPGAVRLGAAYTSDDNYMFGEYNGLNEEDASLIGDLQWQDFGGSSYWQAYVSNLGLDTREGKLTWGRADRLRISVGFDSQKQVRNDDGRTPFTGSSHQQLPGDWVSGLTTSDWSELQSSLHGFDRELTRDKAFLELETRLADNWKLEAGLSYEEKQGDTDVGAAIYANSESANAVLLRMPVDYRTTEFDLGLSYSGDKLHVQGRLDYSEFDNQDDELTWQNPYSAYGPSVSYPEGVGGLGLAPDNDRIGGRITGQYLFSATTRLQLDGSYAVASQDQDYLDYSVNPALAAPIPLPKDDYDGEVATGTFSSRLLMRPLAKLDAEVYFKYRERNYDADRRGYQYIRGDSSNQPGPALTVYNTNHDLQVESSGLELGYRLPWRSKLSFDYQYEKISRKNAAVDHTDEDRYTLGYRIQPWSNFTAKLDVSYAERAADTYQWAQSYYALLDTELINATPDNQRYINHPQLMQYYMANRQQWETRADFTYLPAAAWNLNLNLQWRDDDYEKSQLGLTEAEWYRAYFSASYAASERFSATVYAGYDYYETDQGSRAFNGGQEKNAFDIYPPLPQASDPARNWTVNGQDTSVTVGANARWQVANDVEVTFDYNYVDTQGEQDLGTHSTGNLDASDLPTVETTLHHVQLSGIWHMQENLSLQLDYQYYDYDSDDWAWDGVQADTIDKVLTFGQGNPNESINYVGASVIYHWQ